MIREEAWGVSSEINVSIIGSKIGEVNPKLTCQLDMMGKERDKQKKESEGVPEKVHK